MPFKLVSSKLFAAKLDKLDKSVVIELEKKFDRLAENPVSGEHRMHYAQNYFRTYLHNFRVIYKVEEDAVLLIDIIKRKEGYDIYRG